MIRSDYELACEDAQAMRETAYHLICPDCERDTVSSISVITSANSAFNALRDLAQSLRSLVYEDAAHIEGVALSFHRADNSF